MRSASTAAAVCCVMQRREPRGEIGAIRANLDAERALPRRRQAFVGVEQRADARFEPEPLQTRPPRE